MEIVNEDIPCRDSILKESSASVEKRVVNLDGSGFDPLRNVLFVLGDFPTRTQTFIHRELCEMHRRGHRINVLAISEVKRDDLNRSLRSIQDKALFVRRLLGMGVFRRNRGGPSWATRRLLFRRAMSLPHRTLYHRLRFLIALGIAVRVASKVRKAGYTYIHAHFASFQTEIAMCLSWITGIPYGITSHAYDLWRDRNILEEKIAGAKMVLTCTEFNLKHLRMLAAEHSEKVFLVRHGIDAEKWCFGFHRDMSSGTHEWLAVGRLIPKKGFSHLVDAVGLLRDRGIAPRLTIVGEGPEHGRLASQILSLDLATNISMVGELKNDEVRSKMSRCFGLAVPSVEAPNGDRDGIPNVIIEAMSCGKPVIGTKVSGIPEIVRDHSNGLLVPSGNSDALAEAIAHLDSDPAFANRLGVEGRRTVEREYDIVSSVDAQLRHLAEVVLAQ